MRHHKKHLSPKIIRLFLLLWLLKPAKLFCNVKTPKLFLNGPAFWQGAHLQNPKLSYLKLHKLTNLNSLSKKSLYLKPYIATGKRQSKLLPKFMGRQKVAENFFQVFPLLVNPNQRPYPLEPQNSLRIYWWYKFYLTAVTHQYTMFKTSWALIECSKFAVSGAYGKTLPDLYDKKLLRKLYSKKDKFLFWVTKLAVFKDLTNFVAMIVKWLFSVHLKKHRRIFVLINKILRVLYSALYEYKKIRGYCIFFKGKLGRKGSVRKTKYFAKRGEISYSTKSLRLSYRTFHFGTLTGVVGGGLSVFYNNFAYILFFIYLYLRGNFIFSFSFFYYLPNFGIIFSS